MSLMIKCFPMGPLGENTYLIKDENTGLCSVIDPGYYGDELLKEIGDKENLKYIIITHAHYDHFFNAKSYIDEFSEAQFVGPEADKYLMSKDWTVDYMTRGWNSPNCPAADIYVTEGDVLELGDTKLSFLHTPGHTEGSMCILADKNVFTGDTLFKLSVGNTSFETGSWDALVKSINEKLYTLDEDYAVYPGHGPSTEIGFEKRANPFV